MKNGKLGPSHDHLGPQDGQQWQNLDKLILGRFATNHADFSTLKIWDQLDNIRASIVCLGLTQW